ncbi:hypothetical protein Trco_005395 [Trichoderma cornu-damae]|uniref:Uncharacterized protein n=1 Tax=Trichoderma cornu-damae TaxID=654480 RepID=A0A9P8QPF8_9HYPO|nr:hypothetical protein Trco_005395 [Trichoderma cornu-damae]
MTGQVTQRQWIKLVRVINPLLLYCSTIVNPLHLGRRNVLDLLLLHGNGIRDPPLVRLSAVLDPLFIHLSKIRNPLLVHLSNVFNPLLLSRDDKALAVTRVLWYAVEKSLLNLGGTVHQAPTPIWSRFRPKILSMEDNVVLVTNKIKYVL